MANTRFQLPSSSFSALSARFSTPARRLARVSFARANEARQVSGQRRGEAGPGQRRGRFQPHHPSIITASASFLLVTFPFRMNFSSSTMPPHLPGLAGAFYVLDLLNVLLPSSLSRFRAFFHKRAVRFSFSTFLSSSIFHLTISLRYRPPDAKMAPLFSGVRRCHFKFSSSGRDAASVAFLQRGSYASAQLGCVELSAQRELLQTAIIKQRCFSWRVRQEI